MGNREGRAGQGRERKGRGGREGGTATPIFISLESLSLLIQNPVVLSSIFLCVNRGIIWGQGRRWGGSGGA